MLEAMVALGAVAVLGLVGLLAAALSAPVMIGLAGGADAAEVVAVAC